MKKPVYIVPVLVVLALVGSSFYQVDASEQALVLRFGKSIRAVSEPGLHMKLPFPIDRVARFDQRLMVLDLPARDEPIREFLTLDKKNIEVSTFTCWKIADPLRFLETMTDRQAAEAYLGDVVLSELGKVLGRYDLDALISVDHEELRLDQIAEQIQEATARVAAAECGVDVVDFAIKRINFPEQNRASVFDRMRAERKRIATRYRSEGERQAQSIRAEADRKRVEILAAAEREAMEVIGAADAEATRIYNRAYGADRDFYAFLRTLESYEQSLTKQSTIILPKEMEYLKTLIEPDLEGSKATPPAPTPSKSSLLGESEEP